MTSAIPQLDSKTETPNSKRGNFEAETFPYFFPGSHFEKTIGLIDDGAPSSDSDFEKLGDFNKFFKQISSTVGSRGVLTSQILIETMYS